MKINILLFTIILLLNMFAQSASKKLTPEQEQKIIAIHQATGLLPDIAKIIEEYSRDPIIDKLKEKHTKIAVQKHDNKILAIDLDKQTELIKITRYFPNGELDDTYGFNGLINLDLSNLHLKPENINKFSVDKKGKIIINGKGKRRNEEVIFTIRLLANGSLDNTWAPISRSPGIKITKVK